VVVVYYDGSAWSDRSNVAGVKGLFKQLLWDHARGGLLVLDAGGDPSPWAKITENRTELTGTEIKKIGSCSVPGSEKPKYARLIRFLGSVN
jgi:hypothetical protein